jgi:hypothetical protein
MFFFFSQKLKKDKQELKNTGKWVRYDDVLDMSLNIESSVNCDFDSSYRNGFNL